MTSWNGFIVGSTRIIFAMGRAKMLPPFFGNLHPRYKTPTGAIFLVGGICALTLLGRNALVWFVNASAFGSVMAYLMVAMAFLILRKKEPDLARPFKIKYGVHVAVIVTVMSVGFLLLYTPMGKVSLAWPQEWTLILIWLLLGVVFFIWSRIAYGAVSPMERELLIFGEEYSRREFTHE